MFKTNFVLKLLLDDIVEPSKQPLTVTDKRRLEQGLIVAAIALPILASISIVLAGLLNPTLHQLLTGRQFALCIIPLPLGAICFCLSALAIKGIRAALYVRPETLIDEKVGEDDLPGEEERFYTPAYDSEKEDFDEETSSYSTSYSSEDDL